VQLRAPIKRDCISIIDASLCALIQIPKAQPIPVPTVASATAAETRRRSKHGLPCPVATTNRGATLQSAAKSSIISEVHGMLCTCMAKRPPSKYTVPDHLLRLC
jgi:hypothetical protein